MHRWYGIRHLRYLWHRHQVCYRVGVWWNGGYLVFRPRDLLDLDAIWRGEA
jgi:hypothetical protein